MSRRGHKGAFSNLEGGFFSGYVTVVQDQKNEKEILKNRVRRIERAAMIARIKSLKWLIKTYEYISTV